MGGIVQYAISIDPLTGLLRQVRQVLSAHCDPRPPGMVPELIVVHGISLPPGEFGGPWIEQMFAGNLDALAHPFFQSVADLRVSAHLLVRRDGEAVQFVPFGVRAWHAGESSWQGRSACNDFSVGIELEGSDDMPYEDRQYQSLARLIGALCAAYPSLSSTRVVGHSDIAPGRKSDPGPAFDWPRLRMLLR
ncbi:MAG TPA: 1,6-anhydro-N-acetylmuramyl-L-alanine amidase AmpD [Steroidobacteraceae bacterium]|nr:1,6-anhydro-N-acetylmuramyl-L-alanine amidase AmpD [Steroidobacteraceae bacterium]